MKYAYYVPATSKLIGRMIMGKN